MKQSDKNKFLVKMTILANQMLYEMDEAKVNSEESKLLKKLLENHTKYAFEQPILKSTTFIQDIENKFDTVIRKTVKEYKIKL